MSTIKTSQISLYCHFSKIIKGPGTSFQSVALNQKHVGSVCHVAHQYLSSDKQTVLGQLYTIPC